MSLIYLKNFIRDKNVASITPTSGYGIKSVCSKINFTGTKTVVEYGPATGVFSTYILKNLQGNAKLILIEYNKEFTSILSQRLKDPRVTVVNDSAENVMKIIDTCGCQKADCIISGIPFSWLPHQVRSKIILDTYLCLKPGGKFLAYQTFYQRDNHLKMYLEEHFSKVNDGFEVRNIPPLRIYEAIK